MDYACLIDEARRAVYFIFITMQVKFLVKKIDRQLYFETVVSERIRCHIR